MSDEEKKIRAALAVSKSPFDVEWDRELQAYKCGDCGKHHRYPTQIAHAPECRYSIWLEGTKLL